MPVHGYFEYEDDQKDRIDLIEPGETFFFTDFACGSLCRIIGIECQPHDLGAVIHVIDDEETLETACPDNLSDLFTEETAVGWLGPNGTGLVKGYSRDGSPREFIMQHELPYSTSLN